MMRQVSSAGRLFGCKVCVFLALSNSLVPFFSICQNDQWKRFSSGGWEENGGDSDAHVTERKLLEIVGRLSLY